MMSNQNPSNAPDSQAPNKAPKTPAAPIDRNAMGHNESRRRDQEQNEEIQGEQLPIDPAQEKPELSPLVLAQLDPDAGFNGA